MNEYYKITKILSAVYSGKNLKEEIADIGNNPHLAKIKNHCFGILRNYYAINYIIRKLTNKPIKNKDLVIILQIAIFEVKFSHKPQHAITNDIVNLTKKYFGNLKYNSFINAVTRNYIRNQTELEVDLEKDFSLKYNLPNWFIDKLKIQYKNNYREILTGFNYHPAFGLRVNNQKINFADYLKLLEQQNIEYGILDRKLYLLQACDVKLLPLFDEGGISVQDIAAQYTLDILLKHKIYPEKVLDACAAPGSKTCQILENIATKLTAIDNSESRLGKITENLNRLNLNAQVLLADAGNKDWYNGEEFDLILADVPCSATGTIKRNPDIKVTRRKSDITNFVDIQRRIVKNLSELLKNGGYLLYITCSVFKEENQENVEWFIKNLPGMRLIDELQILPTKYNDSLYYALMQI